MKNRFDTPIPWDDLRYFLAAASSGSLTGAAARLDVSVATVSRRLERLEERLGRKLFQRHPSGLALADDADALVAHAQAVMDGVFDFLRAAQGRDDDLQGPVTVHTLDTVVHRMLAPHMGAFRRRYPKITLVVRVNTRVVRLSNRTADLALRAVRPSENRVIAQKVATLRYGLYASPAYLARRGAPSVPPDDLSDHDLIAFDERFDRVPEAAWLRQRAPDHAFAVRLTTLDAIASAIEHGAGLGLLPRSMARDDLVCLYDGADLPTRDLWLVVHEDLRHVPRVGAVFEFLREVVEQSTAPPTPA